MGWCKELLKEAKEKNISLEKQIEAMSELVEMVEWAYSQNSEHWALHKEKAESHVYGYHFTKECAEKAVAGMHNEDGSMGQYWSLKDAQDVATAMGLDFSKEKFNLYDWYYTINMEHSDYYDPSADAQVYLKRAMQFLKDKDGPEGKAKKYWLMTKA